VRKIIPEKNRHYKSLLHGINKVLNLFIY